jgi:hypothetical protein|tara:strand:- start:5 stop:166 length:162 start_codon:yes stop_codon:yes gene_type:complete
MLKISCNGISYHIRIVLACRIEKPFLYLQKPGNMRKNQQLRGADLLYTGDWEK